MSREVLLHVRGRGALSIVLLVAASALAAACATTERAGSPSGPVTGSQSAPGAALVPAPAAVIAKCVSVLRSREVCPRLLPRVDGRYKARTFFLSKAFALVDISYSGPYPGLSSKNAPPRFVHVVVKSGDLSQAFPFAFPSAPSSPPGLPAHYLRRPLAVGNFTWGPKTGTVVLAPVYPIGGLDGGHLVFRWTSQREEHAVSMHAWPPLSDSMNHLEAIVASIP